MTNDPKLGPPYLVAFILGALCGAGTALIAWGVSTWM